LPLWFRHRARGSTLVAAAMAALMVPWIDRHAKRAGTVK
jgi:hypothetical protein